MKILSSRMVRLGLVFGMLLGVVFLSACAPEYAIPDETAYFCETDSDCKNSCQYGAINSEWYLANVNPASECLDGCDGPGSRAPKCIKNVCTAIRYDGEVDPGCTQL